MRRLGLPASAVFGFVLLIALSSAPAEAVRLEFSEYSNDATPASLLQASLDFTVSGSTLLVQVTNQTEAAPFEIYWIFFNASDDVEGLAFSGYTDPAWGLFDAGYWVQASTFGTFDYALRPYVSSAMDPYVDPGETRAFTLSITCAVGAVCDASDFVTDLSDGATPVLASMRFVQAGVDVAFGGTNAVVVAPEPATAGLLALGLAGLAATRRRR